MTRIIDRPEPGFWAIRLVKKGKEVPARIYLAQTVTDPVSGDYLDRSPFIAAEVDGEQADPYWLWTVRGQEISADDFAFMTEDRTWVRTHAPESAEANPRKGIDRKSIPIPFL